MSAPSPSRPSRPLFEQVVDGLYRGDLPGLECAQPLLAPSDRGPQGDAVVTELSLRLQILQRLERLVRGDRLHTGVVQLVEVDPIRAQAAQARLERLAHKWSVPALGPLALRVLAAPGAELIAELGRELDLVPVAREHPADQLLVGASPVRVAGVEEADPQLERPQQQALPLGLAHVTPPIGAQGPGAEPDLGRLEVGVPEAAAAHAVSLDQPPL